MHIDSMENLLQRQADMQNKLPISYEVNEVPHTTARQSASLEDFMEMISMLISKSMKKMQVEFSPDEGARPTQDLAQKIEHPYIYYELISREPKSERKPRVREDITEITRNENDKRGGRIWGQKFKCLVQFNILACDYKTANKVMNDFESLIFNYTAYFKKNGVAEILFERHFTDKNLDIYRQSLSVRSMQYYVEVEKLFAEFVSDIRDIAPRNRQK